MFVSIPLFVELQFSQYINLVYIGMGFSVVMYRNFQYVQIIDDVVLQQYTKLVSVYRRVVLWNTVSIWCQTPLWNGAYGLNSFEVVAGIVKIYISFKFLLRHFSLHLKAHLHLQFLLRFSSSDGCERVDELWNVQMRVHQWDIYSKIASANGLWQGQRNGIPIPESSQTEQCPYNPHKKVFPEEMFQRNIWKKNIARTRSRLFERTFSIFSKLLCCIYCTNFYSSYCCIIPIDKESTSDESRQSPPDSLSFLAPPPSELPRTTSAGSLSIPASRPRPKVQYIVSI